MLIDLSFDHHLSLHRSRFSDVPLADFNTVTYLTRVEHEASLSHGAGMMLARLQEYGKTQHCAEREKPLV